MRKKERKRKKKENALRVEVGELLRIMNSTEHKAMNGPGWSRMDGWRVNK